MRAILVTDLEPEAAVRALPDTHLLAAPGLAAALLSFAWHELDNAMYQPLPDDPADDTDTPWLQALALPARTGTEDVAAQPRRALYPGDYPAWRWHLYGSPVLARACGVGLPDAEWVTQLGGNYDWVWRYGFEALSECRVRFDALHKLAFLVWALEPLPPSLRDTREEWSLPTPRVEEHLCVVSDGYFDTVETYRKYLRCVQRDKHIWTQRDPPSWMKEE